MFYRLNMPIDILEFIPYYIKRHCRWRRSPRLLVTQISNLTFGWAVAFLMPVSLLAARYLMYVPLSTDFSSESPPEEASNYSAKGAVTALLVF